MKIVYTNNKVAFSYLKAGDIFSYANTTYAKIEHIKETWFDRNAIDLNTWEVVYVPNKTLVEPHFNATLTL